MTKLLFSLFFSLFCFYQAGMSDIPSSYIMSQKTSKLVLYHKPNCPYCKKVISYLEKIHKTLPMVDLQKHPEKKSDLIRIGGKMQIPCLIIQGKALYESDQILKWIKEHANELDPA